MPPEEAQHPPDPGVLQRRASDPRASVWVAASAGTGKTKVLTDRVLRLLINGTPPHRLLCITFTKAAAAEMASRISGTLGRWAMATDDALTDDLVGLTGTCPTTAERNRARRLFAAVVDCPGGMKILTIHGFCQSLLRRFPLESGLVPHFDVMDERTADALVTQALHRVLHRARHAGPGGAGPETAPSEPMVRMALEPLTAAFEQDALFDLLREAMSERGQLRRLLARHGGVIGLRDAVYAALGLPPGTTVDAVTSAACDPGVIDAAGLREACRALATGSKTDIARGLAVQAWLDADRSARTVGFVAHKAQFLTTEDKPRASLITKKAAGANPAALSALRAEADRLAHAIDRRKAAQVATLTGALLAFADALLADYQALKRSRALLDYDDLVLAAQALLSQPGVAAWVLFKLDGGLDHILIDEAQDTNPEQWDIVRALSEEFFAGAGIREMPGEAVRTVFAVGDDKQSIFSFQRAAPAEFDRMRRFFAERVVQAGQAWAPVQLEISFRSTRAVLETVDRVFAGAPARTGVTADPTTVIRHIAWRRGQAGRVELWPLARPKPVADPQPWQPPVAGEDTDAPQARLAVTLAAHIATWLQAGEWLPARDRPIVPGDILVLVRRRTAFVAELVRALKERGVPVAGVDRMVLTEQLSVMDLTALAGFLLLPDDDLTLATVLKGPLLAVDENALYGLAHPRRGSLWAELGQRAENDPAWHTIHAYLAGLLARTDFEAPHELFATILARPCPGDPVSGRRALLGRLGPDAQDPIDEFLQACLSFQDSNTPSLQAFLAWLEASPTEIKREQDQSGGEDAGQVHIMTVHGAKGLQAPVVILPDTVATPARSARILWPDADRRVPVLCPRRDQEDTVTAAARAASDEKRDQEYRRLLYVALTRAEDRLVVCGWRGSTVPAPDCWYTLVVKALTDHPHIRRLTPSGFDGDGWEGVGLCLDDAQSAPPETERMPTAGVLDGADLPSWAFEAAPGEPEPARPLVPSRPDDSEPPVRPPLSAADPGAFARGLLIHRLLQGLPDLPEPAREAACRRYLAAPGHGLDTAAQNEIADVVLRILGDPSLSALFGPGSRAEVPMSGLVYGRAVSGQVDRLLVTDDHVWVLDYKTNRPAPAHEDQVALAHCRQMVLYRAIVRAVFPTRHVQCCLLWTDGPQLMPLSDALLDRTLAHWPGMVASQSAWATAEPTAT